MCIINVKMPGPACPNSLSLLGRCNGDLLGIIHALYFAAAGYAVSFLEPECVWTMTHPCTHWRPNAFKHPVNLSCINPLFIYFWYMVQTEFIDKERDYTLLKTEGRQKKDSCWRRSSQTKHFPGLMSGLYIATAAAPESRGREREKKGGRVKIGFAEGSSWNIHHSMLLMWDPTTVSGGAEVGKWKTRSLVTERGNSNTRREMARTQQRKLP